MLKFEELKEMLEKMEIPVGYYRFDEEEAPDFPYIIWALPTSDNFEADGVVYEKYNDLVIELYVAEKSPELEERLENLLDEYQICWSREEDYDDKEKVFIEQYTATV